MTTQELIMKYCIAFSQRYTRKQKNIFIGEIGKEFENLGYSVRGAVKKKRGVAINLMVGDVANAKTCIVVNYDTPQHNYGNPIRYYPFDGPASFSSSFFPIYTPLIISCLILLYLFIAQFPKIDINANLAFSAVIIIATALVMAFAFVMTRGVANKVNFNRNTSGIVCAVRLAESLSEEKRKEVAFVLTDNGNTNHAGDYMLREALPTTIDKRLMILLDCLGDGSDLVLGYREDSEKDSKEVAKCFEPKIKRKLCEKNLLKYTSFSFYLRGLKLSRGTITNGSLIVENTCSNKDMVCEEKFIDEAVAGLKKYIER